MLSLTGLMLYYLLMLLKLVLLRRYHGKLLRWQF
jgi:hypothetical protein